jgi:regulation of enolase protein 1 (concanavalin A-like superfamily)/DNA-directed RNA polymerase subunit RPC12/RpoP
MSEFKYACPVCGQHIKCDSSQAGTVMECPTCFQKIVVPQAPENEDQKFILTGTRLEDEKKTTTLAEAAGRAPRGAGRKFPVAAIIFILALLVAIGAGVHFYSAQIALWLGHWKTVDVGAVGSPGSFNRTRETWNITGSGADIWGATDAFRYVYRPANGDVTLTARVLGLQKTDPWAKAGLMIRESLAPDSVYAMALVTPSSGVAFQVRTHARSQATSVLIVPTVPTPCWLRLSRQNDNFTASYSDDGKSWTPLGSTSLAMQPDASVGLAVTAHNYATLCQASFEHVNVNGGTEATAAKSVAPATNQSAASDSPAAAAPPIIGINGRLALNIPKPKPKS